MTIVQTAPHGRVLKRLRRIKGMKQSHLADLLDVHQSTVARWERGQLDMSDEIFARARAVLGASSTQDDVLKRLVETSTQEVHLICDFTHRLLAASPAREAAWRIAAADLIGQPLIGFASEDILRAEARLDGLGWRDGRLNRLVVTTGANRSPLVPIRPSRLLWERLCLGDGAPVRLVTTLN